MRQTCIVSGLSHSMEQETQKPNPKGSVFACFGGPEGARTLDLTDANRTLSQTELQARNYIVNC